ncbi:Retrovirus-related pol Polyprotein [Phytophthora palmivora]|uniref:Retrovirus-related pol Polyprotein n=1 Tax=Phytophthora palmivora TaxID=4796 RepID=A0A2P4Y9Q9_9STRA|nr:Retrovirus-related pol Polyprotein [Phytophthora palmivora]
MRLKRCVKDIPYREAVGSMYLMVGTRPDMAFYMREHWKAVVIGLKCLSGTKDYGLLLGGSLDVTPENLADKLIAYSDADYSNLMVFTQTPHCGSLNNRGIIYRPAIQHARDDIPQTAPLRVRFCHGANQRYPRGLPNCIKICYNPELRGRSKHIHVRYCFVQEKIKQHEFSVANCNTKCMVADIFIKALVKHLSRGLRAELRIKSLDAQ